MIAATPEPPYLAVIFTSVFAGKDEEAYEQTAERMLELAAGMEGFLGAETPPRSRSGLGITVSYWRDEAAIARWRAHADHRAAKAAGRRRWYRAYALRIARVEAERRMGT